MYWVYVLMEGSARQRPALFGVLLKRCATFLMRGVYLSRGRAVVTRGRPLIFNGSLCKAEKSIFLATSQKVLTRKEDLNVCNDPSEKAMCGSDSTGHLQACRSRLTCSYVQDYQRDVMPRRMNSAYQLQWSLLTTCAGMLHHPQNDLQGKAMPS